MKHPTPHQLQILKLVMEGKTNKKIAATLGICEGTVKQQLQMVNARLGTEDRTSAVVTALRLGDLQLEDSEDVGLV